MFKYLINDSYYEFILYNSILIFKSINDYLYLIYTNKFSIIRFDLINEKKINEIKNAHIDEHVKSLRHLLDKNNKRDLILSVSSTNVVKVWDIKNFECLLNLEKVNNDSFINSACFLNYKNEIYILSSNSQIYIAEQIKVYNLKGNIIQKINDSNDNIYFIDIYYDNELSNIYILISSKKYCKSFNFKQNRLYHKYSTIDNQTSFGLNIIKDKETKLLSSDSFGNINIWNFHSGLILKKICINNKSLYEIC